MTDDDDVCLSEVEDGVCTLTLNNPERRNAWNLAMERRYFDLLAPRGFPGPSASP